MSRIGVKTALGTKLSSKETAERFYNHCLRDFNSDGNLLFDMYGVKQVSIGFARECFGRLYKNYKEEDEGVGSIKFINVKPHIRPILLQGIKSYK